MSMSTTTEVIAHYWAFAVFLIGALGLCSLMLLGARYLGGRAQARAKHVHMNLALIPLAALVCACQLNSI